MLLSWLHSTLSSEIMARVVGSAHAYELWNRLITYFHKQLHAKARQHRVELRSTLLDNRTIQEYLLRIRNLVDNLASIGDPIPINQHLDVILEGLPQEFGPVISVVESKFDTIDIYEVESLLIAHKSCLDKFMKKTLDDAASPNLTHAPASNTQSQPQPDASMLPPFVQKTTVSDFSNFSNQFGCPRGRGGRGG
jgi:hypothetical protein